MRPILGVALFLWLAARLAAQTCGWVPFTGDFYNPTGFPFPAG